MELTERARQLAGENGDVASILVVLQERETASTRVSELEEEVNTLLPAEGTVTLTAEQAAVWARYQELGSPETLTNQHTELKRVSKELAIEQGEKLLRSVAKETGYKASVLAALVAKDGITIKKQDGKHVIEGDEQQTVAEYAESKWQDFMPSLVADDQKVMWPKQTAKHGKQEPKGLIDKILERNKE